MMQELDKHLRYMEKSILQLKKSSKRNKEKAKKMIQARTEEASRSSPGIDTAGNFLGICVESLLKHTSETESEDDIILLERTDWEERMKMFRWI